MDPCVMSFTVVGVAMCMTLARALFRYTPPGNLTGDELAMLANRTRNYNTSAVAFGVVAALATGFGFWSRAAPSRPFGTGRCPRMCSCTA